MNGNEHAGLLTIFLAEAEELLQQLQEQLAEIRYGVDGQRLLDDLHRSFYTLQGGAAVMDLPPISDLAGKCEVVIERLRRRRLPMTPRVFSLLEAAAEALGTMVQMLSRGEAVDVDTQALQRQLSASIQEGRSRVPEASDAVPPEDPLQPFFETLSAPQPGNGEIAATRADAADPRATPAKAQGSSSARVPAHDSIVDSSTSASWQGLGRGAAVKIEPLPDLSSPRRAASPPPTRDWRRLSEAVVAAHRRGDEAALQQAVDALSAWLNQH